HRLARDLVPAAAIAGRILAARGKTPAAARVLTRTWRRAPHPDLALVYAYVRPGDSPRDRLDRVRQLSRITPGHPEAPIALAASAIEARAWDEARGALKPLLDGGRLTARVCALMARIEAEEYGDTGRVREWLARAVGAARDPAWVADGIAYEHWSPVSPTTGQLDAMRWEVPEAGASERAAATALAAKLQSMLGIGAVGTEPRLDAVPTEPAAEPAAQAAVARLPVEPPATTAPRIEEAPAAAVPPPVSGPASGALPHPTVEAEEAALGEVSTVPVAPAAPSPPRPRSKPAESRIFVPPRAPDDPGAEAYDLDDPHGYPSKA
ncbi:MAG TPA: heme biosynthesis protein HemY, partial [Hyphomicrobiaceae bacterium]|nr:heme biosynthesis protein HemY [Hyphomicrobiaceae bacterium]